MEEKGEQNFSGDSRSAESQAFRFLLLYLDCVFFFFTFLHFTLTSPSSDDVFLGARLVVVEHRRWEREEMTFACKF
jgi:hypothetical protein